MGRADRDLRAGLTAGEFFAPKLATVLREGYTSQHLRSDAVAGLTVAVVALPLSMAIAIASGASPAQGLYTAIVGGFIVSALGGSRFQIGGPAGAFIVLVSATIQAHGMDGLLLATFLAGFLLMAAGFLKLGTFIKFIPYPVTVGFTAGIAVIIFASQISPLLGLAIDGTEPGPLAEKLPVLWAALPTATPTAILVSVASIAVIVALKRLRPHWPGMLIAVAGAGCLTALLGLPVETIGSQYGGIPQTLPLPQLPEISIARILEVFPNAVAFALLGSIESLLSAVVADGMTGRRHRSNCELVAQGLANVGSSLFGGICVTGAIARTATNVRAGAHGPVAGMLHAVFLLAFILLAAPLAFYIPLACLAGILAVVAWNMAERHAFWMLLRATRGDAAVLLVTFLLTVFRDLTEAIVVGFALGSVLFIHRMSKATMISDVPLVVSDKSDGANGDRSPYDEEMASNPDVVVYRISGALFFGAAASIGAVLERIAEEPKTLVLDFERVPFIDSSAARTIEGLIRKVQQNGSKLILTGLSDELMGELEAHGLRSPRVHIAPTIADAIRAG